MILKAKNEPIRHGRGKYGKGSIVNGGYKLISVKGRKIFEHRYVMECSLGRRLSEEELVHHLNGNKLDNRLENLQIVSRSEHKRKHNNIGSGTRFKKIYEMDSGKVRDLYNEYKSQYKVASILGCNQKTIGGVLHSLEDYVPLWGGRKSPRWYKKEEKNGILRVSSTEGCRHGDINFSPTERKDGAKKLNSFVLAEGETPGHLHKLTGSVAVFENDTSYFEALEPVELNHPEHGVIVIEPGVYKVWRERERDPYLNAIRTVRD